MRISYLSASIVPSRSANSVHVMKMAQAFASAGHSVTVFARRSEESVGSDYEHYGVRDSFGIEKLRWPAIPMLGGALYSLHVRRAAKASALPDLFYSRNALALAGVVDLGCPARLEVHALPENRLQWLLMRRLLQSKALTALVTISEALKLAYLREFRQLRDSRVIVAHDGADAPESLGSREERMEVVSKSPHSSAHVGYIGHLYAGKGMELIDELSSRMTDVAFHVVGGTEGDIARWQSRTSGRRNLFFYGYVPHGRVAALIGAFDIVLAPYRRKVSTYGGKGDIAQWMSPLKLFEYMAQAKPIIASDLPVLREIIAAGETGLLCDPDDAGAWAGAIERLVREPHVATRIAANARRTFIENYTWDQRVQRVLA